MYRKYLSFVVALLGLIGSAQLAKAAVLLNIGGAEFSGSGAATIALDAITMKFEDSSDDVTLALNTVRLTIKFNGGTGVDSIAKINEIVFNGTEATVTYVSGSLGTPMPFINSDPGPPGAGYTSDGDKFYDFQIKFPESGDTFVVGEQSVYTISGTGITAGTFQQLADPSSKGPWYAAAHINAVTNGNSGHYGGLLGDPSGSQTVPEPASLAIFAVGMGCAAFFRRRKNA